MAFKGFGTTNTAGSTGFNFGAPVNTTQNAGFSLGGSTTATTASSGLSLSAKTSLPMLNLGATQTKPAAAAFGFGSTATTKPTLGFGLGTTTTTASTLTLGSTQAPESTTAFKGLGGVDLGSSSNNNNGNGNKTISQAVKDQSVPEEICKDVKAFEVYVQKQKLESNEVGKFSVRSLQKINEEIKSLTVAVGTISSAVQRNKAAVDSIRSDFANQLKNMEIAHRTQDTPPALQHENLAPIKFFVELVSEFSASMQSYRHQIEELENHLHSLSQPSSLNPEDISMALCKMQESFITLASNLHALHDNIKHIKEQYLAYRRVVHGDHTDIFKKEKEPVEKKNKKVEGPSPFSNLSNVAALAMASMLQQPQQQQAPPQQGFLGQKTGTNTLFGSTPAASGSLFGATTTASSIFGGKPTLGGFGSASTNTLKPALSAGFASTTSSSGNIFFGNTTFNSSAGLLNSTAGKRNKK